AEDGIRDFHVTGVQTCALPIFLLLTAPDLTGAFAFAIVFGLSSGLASIVQGTLPLELFGSDGYGKRLGRLTSVRLVVSSAAPFRSEERRVGREGRSGGWACA